MTHNTSATTSSSTSICPSHRRGQPHLLFLCLVASLMQSATGFVGIAEAQVPEMAPSDGDKRPSAAPAAPVAEASNEGSAEGADSQVKATQPLPGQLSSRFPIDYRNPESSIPTLKERNTSPLEFGYYLQDLLEQAESARKRNDFQGVVRFYRAVAAAVPENAKGWSKLCEAYEVVKDRDRAIRACKYAIERTSVEMQDYTRYIHLIMGKDGPLVPADVAELNTVLAHLEKEGTLEAQVSHFRCEMGVKLKDTALLETCTKALAKIAPDDPKTLVFQWSLAVQKGQRTEAERLIDRAVKAGIVVDKIERMREVTSSIGGAKLNRMAIAILVIGVLLAIASVILFRRRFGAQGPAH